jgi:hypothetical protein
VKLTATGRVLLGYAQRLSSTEPERAMAEVKELSRCRLAVGVSTTIGVFVFSERSLTIDENTD